MYSTSSDREQARFLAEWRDKKLKKKSERLRKKLEKVFRKYVGDDTIKIKLVVSYENDSEDE